MNKQGSPLEKVIADFSERNVALIKTYRVKEYPYHRFFIFRKKSTA